MYKFTESITLQLPNVSEQFNSIKEADSKNRFRVVTEIAAIHVGITANFNMYTESALAASVNTWTQPYPKPIIVNHDELSKPLGRVMEARMDREEDGTAYIALQAAIIDREAAEMVTNELYITGSVGGMAKQSLCSICGTDWAAPQENGRELPCRHQRGKVYDGKLAYRELHGITWVEYSFVNIPSDKKSRLLSVNTAESDIVDIDVREGVQFFSLDMDQPNIVKLAESGNLNLLDELKKKEADEVYENIKTTFLSTLAFEEEKFKLSNNDNTIESETVVSDDDFAVQEKETMAKVETELQDDDKDILSVAEELRASAVEAEEVVDNDSNESDEVETEEMADSSAEESDSVETEEEAIEAATEDEVVEEAETENEEQPLVESDTDAVSDPEATTEEADEATDEVIEDLDKEVQTEAQDEVDPELEELRSQVEALKEENKQLRNHLHHFLAERVVDAKIYLGILSESDRTDSIKEHETRTPSSLADALKDLQRMEVPVRTSAREKVQMEQKIVAVDDTNAEIEEADVVEEEPKITEADRFVLRLTETLMGRKHL